MRQSIQVQGELIDPGSTISQVTTNAAGTGAVSNSFAVVHGSVSATLASPALVKK
jgi:hypothetical protein